MIGRVLVCLAIGLAAGRAHATQSSQTVRPGSVRLVVRDATRLPVAGAGVTLTAGDVIRTAVTADNGVATFDAVAPGLYQATVGAPGFETLVGAGAPPVGWRKGDMLKRCWEPGTSF